MTKEETVIAVATILLGNGVINGIITHILYNGKLKRELAFQGNDMVAKNIQEGLQSLRNLIVELDTQEIYDIKNELDSRGYEVNMFGGECIYPAVFNNWKSFHEYQEKIRECRSTYENYLSCRTVLNLIFIDRYMSQAGLYISEHGGESCLPFWGTIFVVDLRNWQRRFDKIIVKEINKHTYKLESHRTLRYQKLRKRELIGQYENTILYYLIKGKCKRRKRKQMEKLNEILEKIEEKN